MHGTSGDPALAARACAWGGALVFVLSLSCFLYAYFVTFAVTPAHGSAPVAAAVNVALFTAFALHHSVFARAPVRALVARVVPPYLERSCYVWVSSLLFIAVCAWWQPVPGVAWEATGGWHWLLLGAQLAGLGLALRSAAMIDVLELAGVRQLSGTASPRFQASGPYGWMRHPIYAGWLLMVFCAPLMTMTRLAFAVISSAYLLLAIPFEERSLLASGGDRYRAYMRQVRWKLVPGLY